MSCKEEVRMYLEVLFISWDLLLSHLASHCRTGFTLTVHFRKQTYDQLRQPVGHLKETRSTKFKLQVWWLCTDEPSCISCQHVYHWLISTLTAEDYNFPTIRRLLTTSAERSIGLDAWKMNGPSNTDQKRQPMLVLWRVTMLLKSWRRSKTKTTRKFL